MEKNVAVKAVKDLEVVTDADLIVYEQKLNQQIKLEETVRHLALRCTRPENWDDLGGKPYLNSSGCNRVARMLGISHAIEAAEVEAHDDGHFTFTAEGVFTLGWPYNLSQDATGTRSSRDDFFSRAKGADVLPQAISMHKVRKAAITNCKVRGIQQLTGLDRVTAEEVNAVLSGRAGQLSSKVAYSEEKTIPFGDYKGHKVSETPPAELKKIKAVLQKNLENPANAKYRKTNEAIIDAIAAHLTHLQNEASASQPSSGTPTAEEGSPTVGAVPPADPAPTQEVWEAFATNMQGDPELMLIWNRVKMKMGIENPMELPYLKQRIEFMLTCQDAMKPGRKKKSP